MSVGYPSARSRFRINNCSNKLIRKEFEKTIIRRVRTSRCQSVRFATFPSFGFVSLRTVQAYTIHQLIDKDACTSINGIRSRYPGKDQKKKNPYAYLPVVLLTKLTVAGIEIIHFRHLLRIRNYRFRVLLN